MQALSLKVVMINATRLTFLKSVKGTTRLYILSNMLKRDVPTKEPISSSFRPIGRWTGYSGVSIVRLFA